MAELKFARVTDSLKPVCCFYINQQVVYIFGTFFGLPMT